MEVPETSEMPLLPDPRETSLPPGFSQCGHCAVPWLLEILSSFRGAAGVLHSGAGCAASFAGMRVRRRGRDGSGPVLACTALSELDLILGPDAALERTLRETERRFAPRSIFVAASCGSGIGGDDIQRALERLRPGFAARLHTVVCEIHGRKAWGSGFDPAREDLVADLVRPGSGRGVFHNVVDLGGDVEFRRILSDVGEAFNFVSPLEDIANLERMADAAGTFRLTSDRLSRHLARRLSRRFAVPEHRVPVPCGIVSTEACLRAIGARLGRPDAFEAAIGRESARWGDRLEALRGRLAGTRVLVLSGGFEEAKLAAILRDLGVEPVGARATEEGPLLEPSGPPFRPPRRIAPGALPPRGALALERKVLSLSPDAVVSRDPGFASGLRFGVPTLHLEHGQELFGWRGVFRLGTRLSDALSGKEALRRVASGAAGGRPCRS